MFASTVCPCCKQNLPEGKRILFFDNERIIAWKSKTAYLSPSEYKIMKMLDKATLEIGPIIDRLYANDANGGPESPSARVLISKLRKKLKPLKLVIHCSGHGGKGKEGVYSLVRE